MDPFKPIVKPPLPRILLMVRRAEGDEGFLPQLRTLCAGLQQRGFIVAVASGISTERRCASPRLRWLGEEVAHHYVPFPDVRVSRGPAALFRALRAFEATICRVRPNLIHTYSLSLAPYASAARLLHRVPFVTSCRIEPDPHAAFVTKGGALNRHVPAFLGTRSIAISSEMGEALHNVLHVPYERIRLVSNGLDAAHFRPPTPEERRAARAALGVSGAPLVLSLVSRLARSKGHPVLLRAARRLRQQGLDVVVLCAGEGAHRAAIEAEVQAAEANAWFRLPGFADARTVLWASDASVLPSRVEGFGNVIAEAMLCGLPCVRTPSAGARDQIEDGVTGLLVPAGDEEACARAITRLLEEPELARGLGARLRRRVEARYALETVTRRYLDLYCSLVEGSRVSP